MSTRKARLLASIAVGAAVVCVAASERARARAAFLLHEAWERSLEAARTLVRGVDPPTAPEEVPAAGLAGGHPAEARSAAGVRGPSVVPAPSVVPGLSPEPERDPIVATVQEPVAVAVREPLAPPRELGPTVLPASVVDDSRRRRFTIASAVAAIVFAFVAAGAASWQQWRPESHDSSSGASTTSALPPAFSSLVAQPRAERLPLARSTGRLTVVVGRSDRAVLVGSNVAAAPSGEQYEVWVIRAGEPRRAGLFSGGEGSVAVALTRRLPAGATVAVTLEPRGGVEAPTGKPLFHATRSLPRTVLAVLADRHALHLPLSNTRGRLSVVVGRHDRAILISSNFPTAPAGKQYEVWVIRDTRPMPAGLFVGGAGRDVIALSRSLPAGATVAVTLERRGGVAAPTSQPRFAAAR